MTEQWQCDLGNGEFDHDWEYKQDTIGDYGVIGGTYTECWMECRVCGATKEANDSDIPCESEWDY